MRTCVVYDSVYGNTAKVAAAIAAAIAGDVPVLRVEQADVADLARVDLLIIGSPVHGAQPTEAMQGLVRRIGSPTREGAKVATFDTRLVLPEGRSRGRLMVE